MRLQLVVTAMLVAGALALSAVSAGATGSKDVPPNCFKATATGTHPLGWPCGPFKHRALVLTWVRATLVASGFRPQSIKFTKIGPRQIQFRGVQSGGGGDVQDGQPVLADHRVSGIVAKASKHEIALKLVGVDSGESAGRYTVSFEP